MSDSMLVCMKNAGCDGTKIFLDYLHKNYLIRKNKKNHLKKHKITIKITNFKNY